MQVKLCRRDFLYTLAALPESQSVVNKRLIKTVAFNYAAISPIADLQYFAKFDVLVTGAILSAGQLRPLRSGNTQLVVYQWSSAHYPDEGDAAERAWERTLRTHAREWLLSPEPVEGGAAAPGKGALWYDFGDAAMSAAFSEHIRALMEQNAYHGVFLDTLGFYSLPEPLQHEFQKRHPALDYNRCQSEFLSKLRSVLGPEAIVFTNQGYRKPEFFLPHADLDLIENSATLLTSGGATVFRPWFKKGAEWDSIEVPMTNLVVPAGRLYAQARFVHINYVQGDESTCERAAQYSFACAKLWDQLSFAAPPGVQRAIRSSVYFSDLGDPVTPSYEEDREAGVAWRQYQNGVVAINSSKKAYRIAGLDLTLSDPPAGYTFLGTHKRSF
jgi:hypothetical protein